MKFFTCQQIINEPIVKISIKTDPKNLERVSKQLIRRFGNLFNILTSGFQSIDILEKNCDKGSGLIKLLNHIDSSTEETAARRIIAFGNEQNDLPLFKVSDVCLAVTNACESLKKNTDKVILSNQEQGVLKEILTWYSDADHSQDCRAT
ncbi:HAD hydrolase family protein [Enterococcus olivae]